MKWVEFIRSDLRFALRSLRRSRGFAIIGIGSIALGIGASAAIYTLIDAVMLRALPVPRPHELVHVDGGPGDRSGGLLSNPLWEQLRARQSGFSAVAAFGRAHFEIAERGDSRRVAAAFVSGDYFKVFGIQAAIGRLFGPDDDVRGCAPIAVLGNGFWRTEYGGDNVVGRSLTLDGARFEIVGVTSGRFTYPEVGRDASILVPVCTARLVHGAGRLDARSDWWLQVMGRRSRHVSVTQLTSALAAVAPTAYSETVPSGASAETRAQHLSRTFRAVSSPSGVSSLRSRYGASLLALMGIVTLLMLIACVNVANLLLARAAAREREITIRLAIGAGRGRLAQQLFSESILLALGGAAGGLALGSWLARGLVNLFGSESAPVTLDVSVNLGVVGFTAFAASVTAILFGLWPAWRSTAVSPERAMRMAGRGVTEGHARFTVTKALVAGQIAVSLVLLVSAGLLVGSLRKLSSLDPGFRPDGVVVINVNLGRSGLAANDLPGARAQLIERARSVGGVRSASSASVTPVSHDTWNDELVVEGFDAAGSHDNALSWFTEVSPGYFATMETQLLAGRDFDASDSRGAPRTAIVNDAAARHYFRSTSVLGRQFRTRVGDTTSAPYTIVGVVENAKYSNLREDNSRIVYLPASQRASPRPRFSLLVSVMGMRDGEVGRDPPSVMTDVRSAILESQPSALISIRSLSEQLASSLQRERMLGVLAAAFGAVALLLSMLGLYGVMSNTVARRRNEIGIRIALGARRLEVLGLVLRDVLRTLAVGIAIGLPGAVVSGRLVRSFLYDVDPVEMSVLAVSIGTLSVIGLIAAWVPARRAAHVSPLTALNST
jgi:putative ABC transport system permease protein